MKYSFPLSVPAFIALILTVGAFILAVIDDNFRNNYFGELVKLGLGGYLIHLLLRG